jgi:hypothetical protein
LERGWEVFLIGIEADLDDFDGASGELELISGREPPGRAAAGADAGSGAGGEIDDEEASAVEMEVDVPRANGGII